MLLMEGTQFQVLIKMSFPDLLQTVLKVAFSKKQPFAKWSENQFQGFAEQKHQTILFSLHHTNMFLKFWVFLPSKKWVLF